MDRCQNRVIQKNQSRSDNRELNNYIQLLMEDIEIMISDNDMNGSIMEMTISDRLIDSTRKVMLTRYHKDTRD